MHTWMMLPGQGLWAAACGALVSGKKALGCLASAAMCSAAVHAGMLVWTGREEEQTWNRLHSASAVCLLNRSALYSRLPVRLSVAASRVSSRVRSCLQAGPLLEYQELLSGSMGPAC